MNNNMNISSTINLGSLLYRSFRSSLQLIMIALFLVSVIVSLGLIFYSDESIQILVYGAGNGVFFGGLTAILLVPTIDLLGSIVKILYSAISNKLKHTSIPKGHMRHEGKLLIKRQASGVYSG